MMGSNSGGNPNMAASWPIIVDGQSLLNETSILPHLLHEASEEAQQQQATGHYSSIENEDINNEEQLQNMIENYSKHVIRQKQQQQTGKVAATGRSSSHLQRKINSTQPTPMSHSHPCLLSEAAKGISQEQPKRINTESSNPNQSNNHHSQQYSDPREAQAHQQTQQNVDANGNFKSRHLNGCHQQEQQGHGSFGEQQQPQQNLMHENMQLKQKIETLQRKCDRIEQLELAYREIERDYEQMLGQHERRDELNRVALQKLEQQLRMLATENEQLRAQNGKIGSFFGQQLKEGDGEPQIHFLLNELIPKNNELMLIQERQRIELDAQNSTLEEQRTHIEVLEKALTNAQERLAAKDRSAVDAVAVVDKCRHLQRMLQEALEDKQRQKEQNGRQVAQLEMELTQLRLQLSKESSSQALGSLGRKGGGTMAANGGSPEAADEMLKLRKALSQKEERIAQLEGSLLQMQRRFGCEGSEELLTGTPKLMMGASRTAELEARAMRLEMEKAEKERRIQELLDDKMRNQMQLNEERRSLEIRVRNLEKDLRHVLGSQSSLASSCGGGHYGFVHADFSEQSPFASIRGQKSSYSQYRSTAELPTSTRVAALCDERTTTGMDVMARMEELGRKLAERRGRPPTTGERTTTVQRPSELGLIHVSAGEQQQQQADNQSHSSSTEQPPQYPADMSPGSEEHLLINGGTPLHRQSAPSSAGSSSKKRYLVNAPASQLNAYLEQLPEATRRRLTGERAGAGGFHLLAGIERNPGGLGRREGGCRRLIRDHSVDARKGGLPPPADIPSPLQQLAPPPNYQEAAEQAAQQRREAAPLPPPPLYQQQTQHQQQQLRQLHQMSNIEEPMQEPPPPPSYPQQPQQAAGKTVNVVEIKGEEGDSDTLTGHKQLVFRRGSLGNTNLIAK